MRPIHILAMVLLCAMAATGQTNKGGISGTVADATGGVIPGATVTVTNLGTNQTVKLTTSAEGSYSATSLDPVTYRITVEAAGFKKSVLNNVKVDTATTVTANVTMEPGEVTNEVTVTAEAPLINAESGTTGRTVTERQIQDVPLFNRSVLDLAVTTPNVSGDTGSEDPAVTSGVPAPGFNLSLNGGRPGSTAILADGANNTGVGVARQVVSFTPETVQEFTVQTSAYSAEYGRTGGGIINATTKSGSNQYNGTALWYTRNPATNARVWTTSTLRPPNNLRTNQFHLSLGGPVWLPKKYFGPLGYDGHNKTFFFFAVEPRYRKDFVVTDTLLPTDAMRSGDFSGLVRLGNGWAPASVVAQFPSLSSQITDTAPHIYRQFDVGPNGVLIPLPALATGQTYPQFAGDILPRAFLDPVAIKALQFMPPVGSYFINANGQLSNFVVNRFVRQDETRYTTRIDHNLTNADRLTFRFTYVPAVGEKGFGSDINGNGGTYSNSRQVLLTHNHTFSPRVINDLRLNYTRGVFSDDFTRAFSVKGGRNLATELGIPSLTAGGMPLFNIYAGDVSSGNNQAAFAAIGSSGSTNNFNVEEQYNITDVVYWNRGNMSWKFGADLNHARLNVTPFFGASGGRWDFRVLNTSNNRTTGTTAGGNNFASYLLGVPNSVLVRPALLAYYYRWNSGAAFVQDDWKVRPNLALNLGLRYSLQLPRTEKNNLQGVLRPDLAQTFAFPATQPTATANALALIQQATGRAINSALVVPFAFSGRGGRSRYLYEPDYTDFEPRFGFAWSPKLSWLGAKSLVIRGGYGISHYPLTGNNRLPNPDFGATVNPSTNAAGSTGTADPTRPVRFSDNPPLIIPASLDAALGTTQDGLVFLNSLGIPGEALFSTNKKVRTPYVQNWNLTVSYELMRNTVVEVAYVGSKGTHLFLPLININPRDFNTVEAIEGVGASQNSDTSVPDPLGRKDLSGGTISVPLGSLITQYAGFNHLFVYFNAAGDSHRHAGYVSLNRRVSRGLIFTANYTYGKSIDTASDASPDKNILTTGVTNGGQVTFGAPLKLDRSISAFDIKHSFASTYIIDLPVGRGRRLLKDLWKPLDVVLGGWSTTGVFRLQGGFPFLPVISDTNRLSADLTHTIRPDLVPGVPLKNPLYTPNCKTQITCEPYVNPAAFERPLKGMLGSAPRTLDIRGPIQRYFDMSFQKNFPFIGEKRRIQFRVDLNNAFNHPNFRISSGTLNSSNDFMGLPAEFSTESGQSVPITTAEYNAWAAFNSRTPSTTELAAIRAMVDAFRPAGTTRPAVLPPDFYHLQLPQGFATKDFRSFDITTLQGYKLYRLRQAYSTGFGQLRELQQPRYIQFGIKLIF